MRFQYEWHNDSGQWFRSYGNELWEFDDDGLMRRREASINDVAIAEGERKFFWPAPGPRPAGTGCPCASPGAESGPRAPVRSLALDAPP